MNSANLVIRETNSTDIEAILEVEKQAFGSEEEAQLVANLLQDETAKPTLSLLAFYDNEAIGHILFTRVYIEDHPKVLAHILAPLAVKPSFQKQGIGGSLIKKGLEILKENDSAIVFVLGHIAYYPKYGFIGNADSLGFTAPYPIPKENADAWMAQELKKGAINKLNGKIRCADSLQRPEYWRE